MGIAEKIRIIPVSIKLFIGVLLIMLIQVIASVYVITSLRHLYELISVVEEDRKQIATFTEIALMSSRIGNIVNSSIITGDPKWEEEYKLLSAAYGDALLNLIPSESDHKVVEIITSYKEESLLLRDTEQLILYKMRIGDSEEAINLFDTRYESLRANLRVALDNLINKNESDHVKAIENVQLSAASLERTILIFLILFTGAVALAQVIYTKLVGRAVKSLSAVAKEFSEGNLSARLEEHLEGEFGQLANTFNSMADKLRFSHENLQTAVMEKTRELASRVAQAEAQNVMLEDTKRAMANLLSDARALEAELKEEKSSVEARVVERTRQLHDQQARLFASIENLPRAFIMTDNDGNVLITNQAVHTILGRSVIPWTLEGIQDRLTGIFDIIGSFSTCLREKHSVAAADIQFITKILDISLTPIFVDEKKQEAIGVLILMKDATEEKILQRSRDEFFSIASHELRTPLTAIRGNASMIKDFFGDKIQDPDVKDMIVDIYESSRRLIMIVNDFLDVSRLELGKIQYKIESLDVPELIASILKDLTATAAEKHISLVFSAPAGDLPKVAADRDRTKQIVFNLAGNSIKFTDKGGVTVRAVKEDGFVRISVADTGRGIPYKSQTLLFRKFQQAGENIHTRDATKGTGLGLYISKLLVEGMGGKITLDKSSEAAGSTFSFTLPVANSG